MRNVAIALAMMFMLAAPARAQQPDTILVNGKVVTVDAAFSIQEALAVRDGRIIAVGRSADIRKLAGTGTRTIDLRGRTVIPGLIDSHLHATRAALSFATEVNWIGATSLADALSRLRRAAQAAAPGSWLVVVTPPATLDAFPERRRPTQAELVAAAPNNPVYVQLAYGWVLMTPAGLNALKLATNADLPAGATFERDANGNLTGGINGNQPAIVALFDKLPKPTRAH